MKPVEIEFLMKDNLTAGLDKSKEAVGQLVEKARQASAAINANIREQRKVITGIQGDLARMERQLAGMKPGTGHRELVDEINAAKKVLAEETGVLNELEKQHKAAAQGVKQLEKEYRSITFTQEQAALRSKSLSEKLSEQKDIIKLVEKDIKALEKAYEKAAPGKAKEQAGAELNAAKKALQEEKGMLAALTEEQERNKASNRRLTMQLRELQDAMARMRLNGQDNTEEYRKMAAEAANLSNTIGDLRAQTNILAHDDANLQGMISGMNGLSGAFTTATGVMSLFASENENLLKVQAKVQSVMAVSMGLQQVFNTLNRDSAFRIVFVTKAKNLLTAANARLATSLGISTVAAQALMATLTLGASVVITGLIIAWDRYSTAQEKAKAEAKAAAEQAAQSHNRWTESVSSTVAGQLTSYKKLQKGWQDLGDDLKGKKQFIEANRDAFNDLGFEVNGVADAENMLVKQTDAVVASIMARAKASAYYAEIEAATQDYIRETLNNRNSVQGGGYYEKAKVGDQVQSIQGLSKDDYKIDYNKWTDIEGNVTYEKSYKLTASGVRKENQRRNAGALSKLEENNRKAKEKLDQRIRSLQVGLEGAVNEERQTLKGSGLKRYTGKTDKKEGSKAEAGTDDELLKLQERNIQASIDLLKEGSEKKRKQLQAEYDKDMAEADALERKWRKAQKGSLQKEQEEALSAARDLARKKKEQGNEMIDQEAAEDERRKLDEARKAWQEYYIEYGSFEEKRIALRQQYADKVAAAGNDGEKARLKKQLEGTLQELDFEEFKGTIDFSDVFGDIDGQSTRALQILRAKLRDYIQNAAKDLKPEDLKTLQDAFEKIDLKIIERSPFEAFKQSLEECKAAQEQVVLAQEELNTVMNGGQVYVEAYDETTGQLVRKLLTQEQAERNLAQAQNDRQTKLKQATKSLHAGVDKVREYSAAASDVLGLLSDFGVEVPHEVGGMVEGIGQTLDGLASIDLTKPMSIVTGTIKTLGGVGKTLANAFSLGGVDFGGKKSIQRYEDAKAKYESYMQVLDRVMSKQKKLVETMKASDFLNADNSYEYAKSLVNKSEAAARNLGRQYLESGASKGVLGVGSKSSRGVDQRKGLSGEAWNEYNALQDQRLKLAELGLTAGALSNAAGGRMTGLFDLTGKQLEWIMQQAPTFWAQLHDDTRKYLEQIIACGEQWEEVQDARNKTLTKMSFDEFYSSWLTAVKDMKSDVKDVAATIEDNFQNAILTSLLEEKYRGKIKALYERWADLTQDHGGLDDQDLYLLRRERDRIAQELINERNGLAKTFGWEDNTGKAQDAKSGGFTAMTQDQATKLEGLFVSGQMHWSSIDKHVENVADRMSTLSDILGRIEAHTGTSKERLKAIEVILEKIGRDGIKVK